jgi:hypothetical protein
VRTSFLVDIPAAESGKSQACRRRATACLIVSKSMSRIHLQEEDDDLDDDDFDDEEDEDDEEADEDEETETWQVWSASSKALPSLDFRQGKCLDWRAFPAQPRLDGSQPDLRPDGQISSSACTG